MEAYDLKHIAWWEDIGPAWRDLVVRSLGLEEHFELGDLRYLKTVENLDCSGTGIRALEPLLSFPNLKYVNLSDTQIADFSPLTAIPGLRGLDLSFCKAIDVKNLSGLKQLESLDISYPHTTIKNPDYILELSGLRRLYVNACKNFPLLKLAKMPRLSEVSMEFSYLSNFEVEMFSKLKPYCHLSY